MEQRRLERLKRARAHSGLSLRQASELSGLEEEVLARVESGALEAAEAELRALARTYDVSLEWLTAGTEGRVTLPALEGPDLERVRAFLTTLETVNKSSP